MRLHTGCVVIPGLLMLSGCFHGKTYHGNPIQPIRHRITQVERFDDHLSVTGWISRNVSFSRYGVRVEQAVDDQGTRLEMRSARFFLTKGMDFEIELSLPAAAAKTVTLDLRFDTPDGLDRVTGSYPIRSGVDSYVTRHESWFTHETPCPACSRPRKD